MPDDAGKTTDAMAQGAPERTLPADAAHTDGGAAAAPNAPTTPATAESAAQAAGETATPDVSDAKAPAAVPDGTTLLGVLDADERIRQSSQQGERTLWAGAVVATLVYTLLIGGQMVTGFATPVPMEQRHKDRRGQDAPESISVELVPDPDKTSKTKRWREGAQAQTPAPNAQQPQPEQMASTAQPEVPEVQEQEEAKRSDEPRSEDAPMLLDIESLVDAAAADFKRNLDHALAKKPQKKRREQQAMMSAGGMQVRGKGASGRSDAFTRSVIAALMKTRPGPFALWGRVLVSFQVTETGKLAYVHLLHSSGNSALDQAAVNAIRKARFERPPPGLTPDERTYIIDYIFG